MRIDLEELRQIYLSILLSAINPPNLPKIKVEFYPYVGINNKIRLRDNFIQVKISDILENSPLEIHHALAEILLKKLYSQRISPESISLYRQYISQIEIREKSIESRKNRGRKILNGSKGEFYDLEEIFNLINQIYFQNSIPKPTLTWSTNNTYRILGHHDSTHQTIVISKSLDNSRVPRFVVEFVVYHEMLHIKHPTLIYNGRRFNHTPAFRHDEKDFAFFDESQIWIEKNASTLKKQIKKGRK